MQKLPREHVIQTIEGKNISLRFTKSHLFFLLLYQLLLRKANMKKT